MCFPAPVFDFLSLTTLSTSKNCSEGNRWGDDPDGGMEEPIFSKFSFGQKVAPKEAFGTKISGITTEFDEEAESAVESAPKALKTVPF